MPAKDHVNPQQLKLFYTAGELMDMQSREARRGTLNADHELRERKLAESKSGEHVFRRGTAVRTVKYEKPIYEDIKESGVRKPVTLEIPLGIYNDIRIVNGNHRIVSANDIDPDMWVPHEYERPFGYGR
jgi:hypothetical protein